MDIGTLFQARNFLNSTSVPKSPMKDINACEELLLKFSDALLVTAFKDLVERKVINIECQDSESQNQSLMNSILDVIVDEYFVLKVSKDDLDKSTYSCPFCSNHSYKRAKTLQKHIKRCHNNAAVNSHEDGVQNYSKNALTLSFLVKNFIDARKHGDGPRIIQIYKFFLLYFKVDHRTKYSFQTLHLLAQINYLLPPALAYELTWNRFVNTKGDIDSNVEIDRHIEHQNKHFKNDIAQFKGKVTEKSLARTSKTYLETSKILEHVDKQMNVKPPSGRHSMVSWEDDVKCLSEQFTNANLFESIPGRHHNRFPGFPSNYPSTIDVCDFKTWVYKKLSEFKSMTIYNSDDIITGL